MSEKKKKPVNEELPENDEVLDREDEPTEEDLLLDPADTEMSDEELAAEMSDEEFAAEIGEAPAPKKDRNAQIN